MRKLLVLAVAVALASLVSVSAKAAEGSDLEISGNVTTVSGFQRPSKNAGLINDGILGDGLDPTDPLVGGEDFGFYVDQVEVDLAKSFGENIRLRADLDFSPHRAPAAGGVYVEQGYVTANIPAGNGVELLLGRFNSGIGLDPIDRNELSTVSFSTVHRTLLPDNLTGVRFGYNWSEATRTELFIVNDLADTGPATATTSNMPSGGFNISYAWGEEGNKSWVKLSGAGGPEQATLKHYSFLGDLSGNWAVSDAFAVGLEGVYRQDNAPAGATDNAQYIGGQLKGRYAFSDVWDGTLRYGFIWDLDNGQGTVAAGGRATGGANAILGAVGTGAGTTHSVSLATSYKITDGAKFILEGSVDVGKPSGGATGYTPGIAGMFAYSF